MQIICEHNYIICRLSVNSFSLEELVHDILVDTIIILQTSCSMEPDSNIFFYFSCHIYNAKKKRKGESALEG